ncbi:heme ABC transporter ATP-binding protein [Flavihumibacter profundi]|uniref:heme ABC transporter ATP-binding protein n=1 Tax=Flavihumibacter profundi TaxID=2716883 RepID=UPI001CC5144A|nr:heme ABC transporter ATP-binding protein [Flavihumibacter profundi]MBZ5857086.1 heme ABC transporter ATP-binding protein [Flavihumibacter profundi]
MLRTENITYSIGRKKILKGITAEFESGKLHMILGPNGSGKSTFLKIFSGELKGYTGKVTYQQQDIKELNIEALAKRRSVMSQQTELGFPLTVEEVVMMGRYPHFVFNPTKKDVEICRQVIDLLSLSSFTSRNYLTLSGGEKQRVQFARVLAQIWVQNNNETRFLFLDEPLNSLDINYQQEFLQVLRKFGKDDVTMIAVIHDINLATQYADNLLFFKEGSLVKQGAPKEIISSGLLSDVFQVQSTIIDNPVTKQPLVIFSSQ